METRKKAKVKNLKRRPSKMILLNRNTMKWKNFKKTQNTSEACHLASNKGHPSRRLQEIKMLETSHLSNLFRKTKPMRRRAK
jgi:hypothetical protein